MFLGPCRVTFEYMQEGVSKVLPPSHIFNEQKNEHKHALSHIVIEGNVVGAKGNFLM